MIQYSRRTDLTEEQRSHGEPFSYGDLVNQMIGFYLVFYIILVAASYGASQIVFVEPLLPGLLFTLVYAHITICIQVAHVSK